MKLDRLERKRLHDEKMKADKERKTREDEERKAKEEQDRVQKEEERRQRKEELLKKIQDSKKERTVKKRKEDLRVRQVSKARPLFQKLTDKFEEEEKQLTLEEQKRALDQKRNFVLQVPAGQISSHVKEYQEAYQEKKQQILAEIERKRVEEAQQLQDHVGRLKYKPNAALIEQDIQRNLGTVSTVDNSGHQNYIFNSPNGKSPNNLQIKSQEYRGKAGILQNQVVLDRL